LRTPFENVFEKLSVFLFCVLVALDKERTSRITPEFDAIWEILDIIAFRTNVHCAFGADAYSVCRLQIRLLRMFHAHKIAALCGCMVANQQIYTFYGRLPNTFMIYLRQPHKDRGRADLGNNV
jgi:hypothetical protein